MSRTLTITVGEDWRRSLRQAAREVGRGAMGKTPRESLNFESPAAFFGQLTALRWQMVREMMGSDRVGVRELARRLGRGVRRVHDDAQALVALGLLEKDANGALCCPFSDIHVDMHLRPLSRAA